MKFWKSVPFALGLVTSAACADADRAPLSYAAIPNNTYVAAKPAGVITLLEFIQSRNDLSILSSLLDQLGGFAQAFDTAPQWSFTFFAPSNAAFNNTGDYFSTYLATPKGKWWMGNVLQHHYVPNSQLKTSVFTTTPTRIQTGTFLYIGTQLVDGSLFLNNVSRVTSGDLPVSSVCYSDPRLVDR
ncbi:hypothetical protein PVAG01_09939 [Phlyctema vagabunda]|uniref:FAS1 domain-containing protein n=1 Tax=Phlyctema vagabunda TaxID=108571 RepID=A0ABR4P4J1_9HELO